MALPPKTPPPPPSFYLSPFLLYLLTCSPPQKTPALHVTLPPAISKISPKPQICTTMSGNTDQAELSIDVAEFLRTRDAVSIHHARFVVVFGPVAPDATLSHNTTGPALTRARKRLSPA